MFRVRGQSLDFRPQIWHEWEGGGAKARQFCSLLFETLFKLNFNALFRSDPIPRVLKA